MPAGSKTAISAGTFRPQRKASSDGSRRDRLIAGRVDRGLRPIAWPRDRGLPALFVFGAVLLSALRQLSARYTYRCFEDAHYARNFEIRCHDQGRPDDMVACNTVGKFVRSTIGASLREPSGLLVPLTLTPPV